jgi:hypothetical protein
MNKKKNLVPVLRGFSFGTGPLKENGVSQALGSKHGLQEIAPKKFPFLTTPSSTG